jgi:hypothetical protein
MKKGLQLLAEPLGIQRLYRLLGANLKQRKAEGRFSHSNFAKQNVISTSVPLTLRSLLAT